MKRELNAYEGSENGTADRREGGSEVRGTESGGKEVGSVSDSAVLR